MCKCCRCYHVGGQYFDACHVCLYFLVMHLFACLFASSIEFRMERHLQQLVGFDVSSCGCGGVEWGKGCGVGGGIVF